MRALLIFLESRSLILQSNSDSSSTLTLLINESTSTKSIVHFVYYGINSKAYRINWMCHQISTSGQRSFLTFLYLVVRSSFFYYFRQALWSGGRGRGGRNEDSTKGRGSPPLDTGKNEESRLLKSRRCWLIKFPFRRPLRYSIFRWSIALILLSDGSSIVCYY